MTGAPPGPPTVVEHEWGHGGIGGGRQAGPLGGPEPDPRARLPLRGGTRSVRPTAAFSCCPRPRRRVPPSTPGSTARRAQLRAHPRRDPAGRHRAPPAGQDPGRRSVPHCDRVLRLQRGRTAHLIDALEGTPRRAIRSCPTPRPSSARSSHPSRLRHRQPADRGTGCSGGAFDLFGLPSDYDGYDAVQTVGAQPWVLNHKVGMVGISYSGFSQLIVAGTDPPTWRPSRRSAPPTTSTPRVTPAASTTTASPPVGSPSGVGREAGARRGPAVGDGRDRHGRQDMPRQPAPPSADPEPESLVSPNLGRTPRSSTSAPRRHGPRTSRCPSSWPAPSRTSRWARSGPR